MHVLQSGDQLGRYRIDRVIGEGPNATAYAASDSRLQRTVVLTVVRPDLAEGSGFTDTFRVEATKLSGLSSPYVAQVHDHETEGERPYVVSQYVAGGDLDSWLQQHGALSHRHALQLAEQVAAGLADAHRHGLLHGDLGPRHVLVRDPGTDRAHAWLAGFPLTGPAPTATVDGDLRGVGRVLVAGLTGTDPGPDAPAPPSSFGPGIDALLRRLLGPDPAARPADAAALRAELADLALRAAPPTSPPTAIRPALPATALPPTAPPAAPPYPPPAAPPAAETEPRRNGLMTALVAAAVVLLLVGGAVAWKLLSGDSGDPTAGSEAAVRGDIDGDGLGDVVLTRMDAEGYVPDGQDFVLRSGDEGVDESVAEPWPDTVDLELGPQVQLADIDGDDRPDRVFTSFYSPSNDALIFDVVPAEGEPTHQELMYTGAPWNLSIDPEFTVTFGDMNQDGRDDLLLWEDWAEGVGIHLFVALTGEDGTFGEPEQWYTSDYRTVFASYDVADFDGDGNDDVLAFFNSRLGTGKFDWTAEIQLLTSDGSTLSESGELSSLGQGYYSQGITLWGDLDADGADEPIILRREGLATIDLTDGTSGELDLAWEAGADNRGWRARVKQFYPSGLMTWSVSDVDGDGDDDLVFVDRKVVDDQQPVVVRLAEDGELGEPMPWGAFDCAQDCARVFRVVTAG